MGASLLLRGKGPSAHRSAPTCPPLQPPPLSEHPQLLRVLTSPAQGPCVDPLTALAPLPLPFPGPRLAEQDTLPGGHQMRSGGSERVSTQHRGPRGQRKGDLSPGEFSLKPTTDPRGALSWCEGATGRRLT